MSSTNAAEAAASPPKLWDFCRPRIHDLSKLGWKEKLDAYGNLLLKPGITRHKEEEDKAELIPFTSGLEERGEGTSISKKRHGVRRSKLSLSR